MFLRSVECVVDTATWPAGRAPPTKLAALAGTRDIDVYSALMETAFRTRPPTTVGIHLADTWAWTRYFPAIGAGPALRLRPEWEDIDAHQKTILADDWGIGFSALLVAEALDVVAWADTSRFVALTGPSVYLQRTGKRGPPKSPDFVGLTSSWQFVVLEAKGTQQSLAALTKQLTSGVPQKSNVVFRNPALLLERLVVGLFVPQANSSELARIEIRDPEPAGPVAELGLPSEDLAAAMVQCEFGTLLPMVGLPRLGEAVLESPLEGSVRLQAHPELEDLEEFRFNRVLYRGVRREFALPARALEHVGVAGTRLTVSTGVRKERLDRLMKAPTVLSACRRFARELQRATSAPASRPHDSRQGDVEGRTSNRRTWTRETPTGFLLRVDVR